MDGNKRIALLVTAVFLKMNGYVLDASNKEFVKFILDDVITKKAEIEKITSWLETKMKKD